jgi:hypothetical protein
MLPNMKNTFFYYIKLSLALVLLLQVGEVSAQTKIQYTTGASTAFAGGTINLPTSRGDLSYGCLELDNLTPWLDNGQYAQVNFTNPALKVVVEFWGADVGDQVYLVVNGVDTPITPSMMSCGFIACGSYTSCGTPTYLSDGGVLNAGPNAYRLTITGTSINNFRIRNGAGISGFGLSSFTYTPCAAGGTAPTLSATTLTAACPANTVNLNSLVTSTLPTGATLKWYTSTARTTEVPNPTTLNVSGTFYAFYVDTVNNCFSPASAAVTVTANCPLALATTCPNLSVDLSSRITTTLTSGYTYTYHSGTPATTTNKLSSSVVSTGGTYYIASYFAGQDCYTNTSRPMVVTITNCCTTVAPPKVN